MQCVDGDGLALQYRLKVIGKEATTISKVMLSILEINGGAEI